MALGYVPTSWLVVPTWEGYYTYPGWAISVGWLIATAPLVIGLLAGAIYAIATRTGPATGVSGNIVPRLPSVNSRGFKLLNMFDRGSRTTMTELLVYSIPELDSTTDSATNHLKIGRWVWAFTSRPVVITNFYVRHSALHSQPFLESIALPQYQTL